MKPTRLHNLLHICYLSSLAPSCSALITALRAAHSLDLFARDAGQSTCASDPSLKQCPSSSLFCCPSSTNCISIANNTSVICCPGGQDCSYIAPVSCDITQQNATQYPSNTLHTSDLTAVLQQCADKCCPLGYLCQGSFCSMIKDSSRPPSPSSSLGPAATSTTTPVVFPTLLSNTTHVADASSNSFPAGAVALGLFLGLVVGALIAVITWFLLRRRRRQKAAEDPDFLGKTPPLHSRSISDPLSASQFGGSHRTEFLARPVAHDMLNLNFATPPGSTGSGTGSTKYTDPRAAKMTWSNDGDVPVLGSAAVAKNKIVNSRNVNHGGSSTRLEPRTPVSQEQMTTRRGSRLPPLFPSALRFGMPVTPSPAPRRPVRNEEQLAVPRTFAQPRGRDGSPHQALIHQQTLSRSSSADSHISIDSHDSYMTKRPSTETINVLMRPPTFCESGGGRYESGMSSKTTWGGMIEKARNGRG